MKEINFPTCVKAINDSTFAQCCSLNSVVIPETITKIGEGAFSGCAGLASVTSLNSIAPNMVGAFDEETYSTAKLYIPIGAKDSYWLNYDWWKFSEILEIDTSGISQVETNSRTANGKAVIYTLDGRRVETEAKDLPAGIYIINGKKVMVE